MAQRTVFKTIEIDGQSVNIYVREDGTFCTYEANEARFGEHPQFSAPTLKQLTEKLRTNLRKKFRLAIPVHRIAEGWRSSRGKDVCTITGVTITGIHEGNRNVLYKADVSGETEQSRYTNDFYRRLTDQEVVEAQRLYQATVDTMKAWTDWKSERQVNAKELIDQARKAAAGPAESVAEAEVDG